MKPTLTPFEERFPSGKKHIAKHGTYSEYTNHKCRCIRCREANTRYNLNRRRERQEGLASGEITVKHGTYSTYTNYACRCDECREANTVRATSSAISIDDGEDISNVE